MRESARCEHLLGVRDPRSLDRYSYVENNPLVNKDESGHDSSSDPCAGMDPETCAGMGYTPGGYQYFASATSCTRGADDNCMTTAEIAALSGSSSTSSTYTASSDTTTVSAPSSGGQATTSTTNASGGTTATSNSAGSSSPTTSSQPSTQHSVSPVNAAELAATLVTSPIVKTAIGLAGAVVDAATVYGGVIGEARSGHLGITDAISVGVVTAGVMLSFIGAPEVGLPAIVAGATIFESGKLIWPFGF